MRLLEVEINNLFKYGREDNIFTFSEPLTLITGPNGAGKSSIFEAICYALFERTVRWGHTHGEIMRRGTDGGYVRLTFEKEGVEYQIFRGRSTKVVDKQLTFKNLTTGHSLSSRNIKDTNDDIAGLVGMDFEAFRNSILFGQQDLNKIISLRSGDRLDLLTNFLGIQFLDKCYEASRTRVHGLKDRVTELDVKISVDDKSELRSKVNTYRGVLADQREELEDAEQEYSNFTELMRKLEKLRIASSSARSAIDIAEAKVKEKRSQVDEIKSSVKKKKSNVVDLKHQLDLSQLEYASLEGKESTLNESIDAEQETREELAVLRERRRQITNKIKQIKRKKKCTECEREYTEEARNNLIKKQEEKLAPIKDGVSKHRDRITQVKAKIRELRVEVAAIKKLPDPESIMDAIYEAEKAASSSDRLEEINNEIAVQRSIIKRNRSVFDTIRDEGYSEDRLKRIHNQLIDIKGKMSNRETNISTLKKNISGLKKKLEDIKAFEASREVLVEELRRAEFIDHMFSKTGGVRQIIVENLLPVLNEKINGYLQLLTEEAISVEFTSSLKTKGGKYKNKLEIIITSPEGIAEFASYSGGEKQTIVLAMGLGISELAAESVGADCEFLLLDEVFSSLDSKARKKLVHLLYALQKKFKNVVVISHIGELRGQIPHAIKISRVKGLSRIRE